MRAFAAPVIAVLLLLVVAATATADVEITGAKLDGAVSESAPVGSVIRTSVTGQVTGGDTWRSTAYGRADITGLCADTENGGSGTRSFNATAPGQPGAFSLGFRGAGQDDCRALGPKFTLPDALRVTGPANNPDLPQRCGSDVILILDESGSIDSSNATDDVKDAARAFLDALSGTGSEVALIDFSSTATRQIDYTTVTEDSINKTFEPYLADEYSPGGYTNWEDAFTKAYQQNQGRVADLVVFITDGDPTAINTQGGAKTGLTEGAAEAMRPAQFQADRVKGQGSHVLAVGIGAAVTKETSARRLTAVSGFDLFGEAEFPQADYALVEDFGLLADALRQVVTELCSPSLTVTKLVSEGPLQPYRPARGWDFTATVTPSSGGYQWNQPPPPPQSGAATVATDRDGIATFQWETDNPQANSTVSLTENLEEGYEFVSIRCQKSGPGRVDVLGPEQFTTCQVKNRRDPTPSPPDPGPDPIPIPIPPDPLPPEPIEPPGPDPNPPAPRPQTRLRIVKKLTPFVEKGDRVRFRIIVRNVGGSTARNVVVGDIPPASVPLSTLRTVHSKGLRRVGNYFTWRLGNIRPGRSKHIAGSLRATAGVPGRHRNRALASAANAKLVRTHADTRVLRRLSGACPSSVRAEASC